MILADVHNHTLISHGEASAAQMYEAARRLGLDWYGFSEHSPLPPGYACPLYHGDLAGDFPGYVVEVLALRESFHLPGAPRVLLGMEPDEDGLQTIIAEVPLAELANFTTFIRQTTQGRGWFTTEFARYEILPEMLVPAVVEQAKKLGNLDEAADD